MAQPCKEYGRLQEYCSTVQVFIQRITESRYNRIMTNVVQEHPSVQPKEYVLRVADRCDKCGAQAYVMVKGSTGDLLFCGHHYEKIMNNPDAYTKMMAFMLEVVDERDKLVENRSQGQSYS